MKKSLTFWNIFPVSLIIAGVLLLIFQSLIKRKREEKEDPDTIDTDHEIVAEEEEDPVSREQKVRNNYQAIRKAAPPGVKDEFIKILTAQAMHETGNFTSRLYLEQNNLFGMGHPIIRETTSLGDVRGFANYATLEDSVTDMLLWLTEFNLKPTYTDSKDYVKDIRQNGYFTAPFIDYHNALRKHLTIVKNLIQ